MRACLCRIAGSGKGFAGTRKHAHLGNRSTHAHGAQRARQRAHAAHFHHQVDALAALLHGPAIPVRGLAVIQSRIESQVVGALQLLVAAGNPQTRAHP